MTTNASLPAPPDSPAIEDIELIRTGEAPLRFRGQLLATASGQFVQTTPDRPNADFYSISIYVVNDGADSLGPDYVIQIVYTKSFRGTQQHHTVMVTDHPADRLAEFNPLAVVIGFPPHAEYAERQQMLETKCRRQYDLLVSAVLQSFPEKLVNEKQKQTGQETGDGKPTSVSRRLATEIASREETVRFVRLYDNPRTLDPEGARERYIEWLTPMIDAEFAHVVAVLRKQADWLDELVLQLDQQVRDNRGRFDSLADACQHDATQYRIASRDARAALIKINGNRTESDSRINPHVAF